MKKMLERQRVPQAMPMIMKITKRDLLEVVNREMQRQRQDPLPISSCEVTVPVPGGGDWSNEDLPIDDQNVVIEIRWKE